MAELGKGLRAASARIRAFSDDSEAVRLGPLLVRLLRANSPRDSGRLARSWQQRGPNVFSRVPYARIQNQGGRIVPRRHGFLIIPFRSNNYTPGDSGYVRSGKYIVKRGSPEVVAHLRRHVDIKGTKYIERSIRTYLELAKVRLLRSARRAVLGD